MSKLSRWLKKTFGSGSALEPVGDAFEGLWQQVSDGVRESARAEALRLMERDPLLYSLPRDQKEQVATIVVIALENVVEGKRLGR